MEREYSIDVSMIPSYHDNPEEPYFWVIFQHTHDGTTNTGFCGWGKTPSLAWEEAYETFKEEYTK